MSGGQLEVKTRCHNVSCSDQLALQHAEFAERSEDSQGKLAAEVSLSNVPPLIPRIIPSTSRANGFRKGSR
eukprot:937897-Amphidinium_carterae.1